jgi:hypothetical protein
MGLALSEARNGSLEYNLDGHRYLSGTFGGRTAGFYITPYAQLRMKERDFTDEDILELMARPISQHGSGKLKGRREVEAEIGTHRLTVIYRKHEAGVFIIINVLRG